MNNKKQVDILVSGSCPVLKIGSERILISEYKVQGSSGEATKIYLKMTGTGDEFDLKSRLTRLDIQGTEIAIEPANGFYALKTASEKILISDYEVQTSIDGTTELCLTIAEFVNTVALKASLEKGLWEQMGVKSEVGISVFGLCYLLSIGSEIISIAGYKVQGSVSGTSKIRTVNDLQLNFRLECLGIEGTEMTITTFRDGNVLKIGSEMIPISGDKMKRNADGTTEFCVMITGIVNELELNLWVE